MVIGPVNHGHLELVCRETVCEIRAIKDLLRPVRRGSRKEIGPGEWFTEPPKKALGEVMADDFQSFVISRIKWIPKDTGM